MDGNGEAQISPLYVVLIGILSTALMLIIYHRILVKCRERRTAVSLPQSHRNLLQEGGTQSGQESSFVQLIPAYKYNKETGKGGEGDNTCAVCLCEFKEGEEVRRLPDCSHSFHVPCIDMWLCSHSNCPLCRTEMSPSPVRPVGPLVPPDFGQLPHIGG